jgi:hypothetical protein
VDVLSSSPFLNRSWIGEIIVNKVDGQWDRIAASTHLVIIERLMTISHERMWTHIVIGTHQ